MPRPSPSKELIDAAILAYSRGRTVKEVADAIGFHESTVKRHFRRRNVSMSYLGVSNTAAPGKRLFRVCPITSRREKWCSGCHRYCPIARFYRNATKGCGLASACKACSHEKDIERRARQSEGAV